MKKKLSSKEILEKAIQKASKNSALPYAYTMGEMLEELVILQGFCKDLWGEQLRTDDFGRLPNWKLHLMGMVIADDPIEYLGRNI